MGGERRQRLEGYCDGSGQAVLCAYTVRLFLELKRSCSGENGKQLEEVEIMLK